MSSVETPQLADCCRDSPPLVSVVVASWNGRRFLEACLSSLLNQSYPRCEILLVDNGSTDGSRAFVQQRFPHIRLIELAENQGFTGANNAGMRAADGKYIILINNDTRSHPDMVAAFVRTMDADPRLGAAQGKIRFMDRPYLLDNGIGSCFTYTGFLRHLGHMQPDPGYETPQTIFAGKGACLCLRRAALDAVGLLDPNFFAYFEDSDLCWRIWLAGYTVAYAPQAELWHVAGGSTTNRASFEAINYHSFKNRLRALVKNLGNVRLLVVLPLHLAICITVMSIYAVSSRLPLSRAIAAALVWNFRHVADTWRERRDVQHRVRRVSDAEVFARTLAPIAPAYFLHFFWEYWRGSGRSWREYRDDGELV